jgi:hypothetical protein
MHLLQLNIPLPCHTATCTHSCRGLGPTSCQGPCGGVSWRCCPGWAAALTHPCWGEATGPTGRSYPSPLHLLSPAAGWACPAEHWPAAAVGDGVSRASHTNQHTTHHTPMLLHTQRLTTRWVPPCRPPGSLMGCCCCCCCWWCWTRAGVLRVGASSATAASAPAGRCHPWPTGHHPGLLQCTCLCQLRGWAAMRMHCSWW